MSRIKSLTIDHWPNRRGFNAVVNRTRFSITQMPGHLCFQRIVPAQYGLCEFEGTHFLDFPENAKFSPEPEKQAELAYLMWMDLRSEWQECE